jgi:hypothetical protein
MMGKFLGEDVDVSAMSWAWNFWLAELDTSRVGKFLDDCICTGEVPP